MSENRFVHEGVLDHVRFGTMYSAIDCKSTTRGRARVGLWLLPTTVAEDPRAAAQFTRDFERIRQLDHPGIQRVYELGHDGRQHFLTTELLDGETLRAVLTHLRPERLEPAEADDVVRTIGEALAYAHEHGVVHGEVRADNVLITMDEAVKLTNFMAASFMRHGAFSTAPIDDVRDLASLAFELYTGQPLALETAPKMSGVPRQRAKAIELALQTDAEDFGVVDFLRHAGLTSPPPAATEPRVARAATRAAAPREEPRIDAPRAQYVDAQREEYIAPPRETPIDPRHEERVDRSRVAQEAPRPRRRLAMPIAILAAAVVAGLVYGLRDVSMPSLPAIADNAPPPSSTAAGPDAAGSLTAPEFVGREPPASPPPPQAQPNAAVDDAQSFAPEAANHPLDTVREVQLEARAVPAVAPAPQAERPVSSSDGAAASPTGPSVLSFATATTIVRESAPMASLEVLRTGPLDRSVAFVWWTSEGSARGGDDYAASTKRVETIPEGARSSMLHVPLVSDALREADEFFEVHIADPEPRSVRLGMTRATVKVLDDDL